MTRDIPAGRNALTVLFCPDGKVLKNRLEALHTLHGQGSDAPERHVFWADEGLGPAFWEHLTLQGLLAKAKFLVLRNAQNLLKEHLEKLAPYLRALAWAKAEGTTPRLLLCFEGPFEKGAPKIPQILQKTPEYENIRQKGLVEILPGLTPTGMPGFIKAEAAGVGLSLSAEQIRLLAERLPVDGFSASSELAKLALLADTDGRVADEAVRRVESAEASLSIFAVLRALQHGDVATVWRFTAESAGADASLFGFLAILRAETGSLWQLLMGESPSARVWDVETKKKTAINLGASGIAAIWDLALKAEKSVKSGEKNPEQAFGLLVADLFRLFEKTGQGR